MFSDYDITHVLIGWVIKLQHILLNLVVPIPVQSLLLGKEIQQY